MTCKHYDFTVEESQRHFIPSDKYNNCVLCVAEFEGPMTQEKVGGYLGLTKMRISQIERQAIKKLQKKKDILFS